MFEYLQKIFLLLTGQAVDSSIYSVPVSLPFTRVGVHNADPPADWTAARTLTPPATATKLLIQTLTQNVRFTLDGTAPAAAVGFQLKAGDTPTQIPIASTTVVKVIEEAATAEVQYQWGK